MNLTKIFRIFGYFVSIVMFVFGLVLVTEFFGLGSLRHVPDQFRITFGVVFILYGIYRFVRLYFTKEKKITEKDEEE